MRVILVCTVQAGINEHEIGPIVRFALERPWITGVSFQPASYVGRHVLPDELERRITFSDVIQAIAKQCSNVWQESDFSPLPCAHPNAHSLAYAYRAPGAVVPLARFIALAENLNLLSGSIIFNRTRARELVTELISRQCCSVVGCGCDSDGLVDSTPRNGKLEEHCVAESQHSKLHSVADEFFRRVLAEDISQADVFRITTTSFMDAYKFDVRQEMKSCVHFVLPSGHIIPFSAYNLLYRNGLVPLPRLRTEFTTESEEESTKNRALEQENSRAVV
jgi:7,8-dihydro-6-hydroxymethylpterin dimethyltransferase